MKLAVFTKNRSNPAYDGARVGAERAARHHGVRVLHFVPERPDDALQQIALIDEALACRPDAVVMSPVHPTRVDGAIRRIHAANIPIVALVSPVLAVPCVSFVASDDYRLANEIARYLFETMCGRGRVLLVGGHEESFTSVRRLRGFRDAAGGHPRIAFVGTVVGDYIRPTAHANTARWLSANPDAEIDACLVANDIMALGVIDALREAGRRALVVGVNAIPEAIPALESGDLLATADFNAMRMAYLSVEIAVRHLRGETVPERIHLPVEIVTHENCSQYRCPYEERSVLTLDEVLGVSKC